MSVMYISRKKIDCYLVTSLNVTNDKRDNSMHIIFVNDNTYVMLAKRVHGSYTSYLSTGVGSSKRTNMRNLISIKI